MSTSVSISKLVRKHQGSSITAIIKDSSSDPTTTKKPTGEVNLKFRWFLDCEVQNVLQTVTPTQTMRTNIALWWGDAFHYYKMLDNRDQFEPKWDIELNKTHLGKLMRGSSIYRYDTNTDVGTCRYIKFYGECN